MTRNRSCIVLPVSFPLMHVLVIVTVRSPSHLSPSMVMCFYQRRAAEGYGGGIDISDQRAVDSRSTESSVQRHR